MRERRDAAQSAGIVVPLLVKKYYHAIKLPDGTAGELGAVQPTGVLRIVLDNKVVKVFIDGQAAVVGTMSPMGQLVGFEIDVVKAKNGTLFFTDFADWSGRIVSARS